MSECQVLLAFGACHIDGIGLTCSVDVYLFPAHVGPVIRYTVQRHKLLLLDLLGLQYTAPNNVVSHGFASNPSEDACHLTEVCIHKSTVCHPVPLTLQSYAQHRP